MTRIFRVLELSSYFLLGIIHVKFFLFIHVFFEFFFKDMFEDEEMVDTTTTTTLRPGSIVPGTKAPLIKPFFL